ncbi:MAG TPA: addiction module protein [Gemmatimonadales bacterium]|nr:addiction module protein [Gemmatimonadales bacterium]
MSAPAFDFSRLSPAERIQLAEDLWDSLPSESVPILESHRAELDRRMELHRQDPQRGRPWDEAMRDLEKRGG